MAQAGSGEGGPRRATLPLYIPFRPTGCPVFTEVAWADATSINSASHDHTSWVRENETQRERKTYRQRWRGNKRGNRHKYRHEGPRPRQTQRHESQQGRKDHVGKMDRHYQHNNPRIPRRLRQKGHKVKASLSSIANPSLRSR